MPPRSPLEVRVLTAELIDPNFDTAQPLFAVTTLAKGIALGCVDFNSAPCERRLEWLGDGASDCGLCLD